jgi:alanine dehydrogenase
MSLRVGVPQETKPLEGRIALTPGAVRELRSRGVTVGIQRGAGLRSQYPDAEYEAAGALLLDDATSLYDWAELVVKVKEPVGDEVGLLRRDQRLFCYLHLAANPDLTQALCDTGLTAIAFETVEDRGRLPILVPMSDIAGRIAVQVGTHLLHTPMGGKGVLLGGLPSVSRGRVVVIGAGNAGGASIRAAAALGAQVTVFDRDPVKLEALHHLAPNITTLMPERSAIDNALAQADLLVGAVLITGAAAPRVVDRAQVAAMQEGSVIVDIAVDQGGCIETTRPTGYDDPTYTDEGVVHFCVTNMPGAVPRSATQALSAAMLPYLLRLIDDDWRADSRLARAVNVADGVVVHPALQV